MLQELRPVWSRWEETHVSLLDCLEQFPEERLQWRPGGTAPAAARILFHIGMAETNYAALADPGSVIPDPFNIRQAPDAQERAAATVATITTRAAARELVEIAARFAAGAAARATPESLARGIAREWYPLSTRVEGEFDGLWFFEQMTRHKAYHLGQLWYIAQLLEAPPDAV